ncbi:MAG: DUF4340 domain-containing protein [Planctomycetota bacterium]|nr:DUF4340 domain-containing protein [Planctomycetota bacterium]
MKTKSLAILSVAALATIGLAAFVLSRSDDSVTARKPPDATTKDGKARLFPGLYEKVNDVATVTIQKKTGTYTLHKTNEAWGLADKANFPIEMDSVRKMLIAIGEMHKLEAKTSDAARYVNFGVQEPDAEGSESALITLKDAAGNEMAKFVLGKEHDLKGAVASNQRYVRKVGDAQTWLVQGSFDSKEKGTDLLKKSILEVKKDRIRSIEITQPDGELLVVDRASPLLTDFTLVEIPEGKELTYPTAPGSVASGLEYVNLEDVEPRGKIDFASPPGPVAKFKTFDGLVVTVTTKDQDGKAWAKFEASFEEPVVTPPLEAPKEGEAPPTEPEKKTPDEVRKEVADLNARLSKWDYQISSYTRTNFGKKKSELLKDKAPPVAPADPNATPGTEKSDEPFFIPNTLPPEIQQQIKADQEAKGNKVIIGTPKSAEGQTPGGTPPIEGSTPTPAPVTPEPHVPKDG